MKALRLGLFLIGCIGLPMCEPAAAQQIEKGMLGQVLDCAMHEEENPWVPAELRSDGLLRFTYLYEGPRAKPGPYDYDDKLYRFYIAFWNASKTKGEFLVFSVDRAGSRRWFTVSNEGHITNSRGKLALDFFQGGAWTEQSYMIRLRKLVAADPETISVRDVKRTGVLCDSFLNPHPEWDTQPPPRQK